MSQANQPSRQRARTPEGTFKGNPDNPNVNEAWEATELPLRSASVSKKVTPNGSKPKIGATEKVVQPSFMSVNIVTN